MNSTMREAFMTGSGVDPDTLKATVALIAVAVILIVCVWVVTQLMDAYRNERMSSAELTLGTVKLLVLASLLMFVVL